MNNRSQIHYIKWVSVVVLTLSALLSAYIELFPINFSSKEYPLWKYQEEFMNNKGSHKHRVLLMGDSRIMAGLIPLRLTDDTYSFCLPGSTYIDAYYMLKHYLENNESPEHLILSVSPFAIESGHYFWERSVKYRYHSYNDYWKVFKNTEMLNDNILGSSNSYFLELKWLAYRLHSPKYFMPELKASHLVGRRKNNFERYERIKLSRGHTLFGTKEEVDELTWETDREIFEPSKLLTLYLHKLIKLTNENNIKLLLITIPFSRYSYDEISDEYKTGYESFMKEVERTYPEISIEYKIDSVPDSYYGDEGHMNRHGAELYTKQFKRLHSSIFKNKINR